MVSAVPSVFKSLCPEIVGWIFKKLEIELPYDLAIPILSTHSKNGKAETQTDTGTPVQSSILRNRQEVEATQASIAG